MSGVESMVSFSCAQACLNSMTATAKIVENYLYYCCFLFTQET